MLTKWNPSSVDDDSDRTAAGSDLRLTVRAPSGLPPGCYPTAAAG